jgi:heparanase 1
MRSVLFLSLGPLLAALALWHLRPAWVVDHLNVTDGWASALLRAPRDAAGGDAAARAAGGAAAASVSAQPVLLSVDVQRALAAVDPRFLSVAIDTSQLVGGHFWSASGRVEVGRGSERVPALDLRQPRLLELARGLGPAYLRVGGTEADHVYYAVGAGRGRARPAAYELELDEPTWDALVAFAGAAGFELVFTLNAGPSARDEDGAWRADNAEQLFEYAAARGHSVAVWELGNEVNGHWFIHGLSNQPSGPQYASDLWTLRRALERHFDAPKLAGPASVFFPLLGEPMFEWFGFLPRALEGGGGALDILTWHYYPQQSRRCPVATRRAEPGRLLSPAELDEGERWAAELRQLRDRFAPRARLWLGETGHAQCGGEPGLSDRYASGLWWLDQLGQAARGGHDVVVRQTLVGSDYGLLDGRTLRPRPDYYNSLLWRKFMGHTVLDVHLAAGNPHLRAYAHCSPDGRGVSLLVQNQHPTQPARFELRDAPATTERYGLSAPALDSDELWVNDVPLVAGAVRGGASAELELQPVAAGEGPWRLEPASSAFFQLRGLEAPACDAASPTVQLRGPAP